MSNRYKLMFEVYPSPPALHGATKYGEYFFDTPSDGEAVEHVASLVRSEPSHAGQAFPVIGKPGDTVKALALYRIVQLPVGEPSV